MARFDFQSPGAAYTDAMAKLLAERKAEARQQMLDELARAADERAAKQSESALRLQDQQINTSKAAADREELKFYMDALDPTIDPATQFSPDIVDRLVKSGRVVPDTNPQPSVQTSETFAAPEGADYAIDNSTTNIGSPEKLGRLPQDGSITPITTTQAKKKYRFIGDEDYRKQQRREQDVGKVILGLLTSGDPKKVEAGQQLAIVSSLRGGDLSSEDIARNLPTNAPFYTVDPDTGIPINRGNIPSNAQVTVLPKDRSGRHKQKVGTTTDGRTIYADQYGNETIGANPTRDTSEAPAGIPVGLMTNLNAVAGAMMTDTANPEAVNSYKFVAQQAVNFARQGNPKVKAWVSLYIDNPVAATQATLNKEIVLTPEEQADAEMLLTAVGARNFKAILMAPTPKPEPPKAKWWEKMR